MNKVAVYESLIPQAIALLDGPQQPISVYANIAALLKDNLPYASWVGFYLFDGNALFLGPFQGKVACVDITLDRGVCGKAAREQKTVIVEDVHQFPGHIACDAGSNSEIVVPIVYQGTLLAVLDLDSYAYGSFDAVDQKYLELLCEKLAEKVFAKNS
jgi:L-methionine (R)-S-oxide reductase